MNLWISLAFCFSGFAALSMTMARHAPGVNGRPANLIERAAGSVVGIVLLATALAVCVTSRELSIAIVAWFGLLTLGALGVAAMLAYRAQWLLTVSLIALVCATLTEALVGPSA